MEEKMTVEDAYLIALFKNFEEPKNDKKLFQGPSGIGYRNWMGRRELFSTVQDGEIPRWWVEKDGEYVAEGPEFMRQMIERIGGENLEERREKVIIDEIHRVWGGKEEYERIFGVMKNHSDLESVDNTCVECGCRGLATYEHTCGSCRAAWIDSH